ncbi:hypothetical protein D3C81_1033630 [compost metagenome]
MRQFLQAPGEFAQAFAAQPVQGGYPLQRGETRGVGAAQAQAFARAAVIAFVFAEIQLAEAGQQRLEPAERQRDAAADAVAARQRHQQLLVVATLGQRLAGEQPGRVADGMQEDRQQADLFAVHLDAHLQVEPVAFLRLLDAHLPLAERRQVELEVRLQADLPTLLAQLRQLLTDEVQPGRIVGQFEGFAGAFRQGLAAAQGNAEAVPGQLPAQGGLGLELADDAQLAAGIEADQPFLLRHPAKGDLALVVEGQCRAVLGLLDHPPLARVVVHAHVAAEDQPRLWRLRGLVDDLRRNLTVRQGPALLLLAFQGEQGGDHVLAVVADRAAAAAVDVPVCAAVDQADALAVALTA